MLGGGTRLQDIERRRHDTAYMNALGAKLTPDPTTAGDVTRGLSEEKVAALCRRYIHRRTTSTSNSSATPVLSAGTAIRCITSTQPGLELGLPQPCQYPD